MKIFDWLRNLLKKDNVQFLGILGEQSDANVYDFSEVVASVAQPIFTEKEPSQWRTFLFQYQFKASACVAFTVAKLAQILYYLKYGRLVKFSPGWIYKQRSPKVPGMWIDNAVNIAAGGLPTEELYPSENLNEEQINALPDVPYADGVAKEFAISPNWVRVPIDFDTIASTIQATQKGIMLWFRFGNFEWFGQGIPTIKGTQLPYYHSTTAVDAVKYGGVDYLVIEDSADENTPFKHRKLISREFFKRCDLARYPISFKFDAIEVKPKYDGSVVSLQDCLKFGGFMPSNVPSTGNYGVLTTEAVKKFQERYNIQQTGTVGPITKAKLLEIFN